MLFVRWRFHIRVVKILFFLALAHVDGAAGSQQCVHSGMLGGGAEGGAKLSARAN